MNKILAILALSASIPAFAQTSVALQYDRDFGSETKLSLAQKTKVGTFDAGLLATRYQKLTRFGGMDDANGFDVGYTNGLSVGPVAVNGRIGYGRLNNVDRFGGGFVGDYAYRSAALDAELPIVNNFTVYSNFRHRNPNGNGPVQNRLQGGVGYAVTKGIGARLGVSHARQAGYRDSSVTAAVNYTF